MVLRKTHKFVQVKPMHWGQRVVISVLFIACVVIAQPTRAKEAADSSKPVNDVRVLIDISGSMKKNDPTNLRRPALNLFVSLLPTGTQSGVWTFGQWVNMLIPHGAVNKKWKRSAKKAVQKVTSTGLYTNIEDVIRRSTWDWANTLPTSGSERSLILLTDGLVDISKDDKKNHESRQRILQELVPTLQKAGVIIHAIALSKDSDSNLLKQLTTATGGKFKVIETSEGLERLFLHLFESVSPTDSLPLKENKVKVDDSIQEMTFLIFSETNKEDSSIKSPSGKVYNKDSEAEELVWHKETHYDLVTIKNPESGYWKVNADEDPDNRVMVVTDLKLISTKLPNALYVGDKQDFHLHLENEGKLIDQQDLLHFVRATINQSSIVKDGKERSWKLKLRDKGKGIDKKAKDGIYSVRLDKSLVAGDHEIEAIVNGTTFRRVYRKNIVVYNDPAEAIIEQVSQEAFSVSVFPYQEIIDPEGMTVAAEHEFPNGETKKFTIPKLSPAEWAQEFATEGINGNHKITIHISSNRKNGGPISATLPPQSIDIKPEDNIDIDEVDSEAEKIEADENSSEIESDPINWGMVSVKVGLFNIIIGLLIFGVYKFSPKIQRKLIPSLFEDSKNA